MDGDPPLDNMVRSYCEMIVDVMQLDTHPLIDDNETDENGSIQYLPFPREKWVRYLYCETMKTIQKYFIN